nr:MAG TPA: hypothetical protein [Caudoviricetes sp.]DAY34059.1 MAG TPA: hypothetical protein [Caudoviricetes sp.]
MVLFQKVLKHDETLSKKQSELLSLHDIKQLKL